VTTETWILVVWWIGLIGAVPPTLLILKEAALVLAALSNIRFLADRTAEAARGIAAHVEVVPRLPAALGGLDALVDAAGRLSAASTSLAGAVEATLAPSRLERLGHWIRHWVAGRRD
jgi:hypothetical protein